VPAWSGINREWKRSKGIADHRLREVVAQVGFTRFEALRRHDGELDIGVERARWARKRPGSRHEIGRGYFHWVQRGEDSPLVAPVRRERPSLATVQGFQCGNKSIPPASGYSRALPVDAHPVALLLTVIALECGYPASAIRERVYASELGYGILLYTASSDAEGTCGLVKAGERIHHHLRAAWTGRDCAQRPVCASTSRRPPRTTLPARRGCHGCLLIAETSASSSTTSRPDPGGADRG